MTRMMLIDAADAEETRVVITESGDVDHFDFVSKSKKQIKGNIFLGKVTRVEPSLQAAFVEYGGNKHGFLSFSEIHPDYYQIPVEDRKRLLEEAEAEAREEEEAQDGEEGEESSEPSDKKAKSSNRSKKAGVKRRGRRKVTAKKNENEEAVTPEADADEDKEQGTTQALANEVERVIASEEGDTETDADLIDEEGGAVEAVEEEEEVRKPRRPSSRRYKIQEVVRPGQILLVQVVKEERGNKGVSLSTYISLAGRYCVLMPNSHKAGGISRKIANGDDRKRLRDISSELKQLRGMNAIIRTAGIDRTRAEIKRDYEYLIKLWNQIREDALASIAPALVYEENDIIKRSIRDHYESEIETILVEGEDSYKQAKEFMKMLMPSHAPKVKRYKESNPIFTEHGVEQQLAELYHSTASLKSGGYVVINPTEALISIDVNSGRSTNERNVEETAYKTNLEACEEIARQLRLRNLGGLIVIDFIDMAYHKYRRNVERALKEALRNDRARIQVGHISTFGLLELSRQRMGASLIETTTETCPHCHGHGRVTLVESTVVQLMRNLQSFVAEHGSGEITVSVSQPVLLDLFNTHRDVLKQLEEAHEVTIIIELHTQDDRAYYQLKGQSGLRFDSLSGFARKGRGRRSRGNGRGSSGRQRSSASQEARRKEVDEEETPVEQVTDAKEHDEAPSKESSKRGSKGSKKSETGKSRRGSRKEKKAKDTSEEVVDDVVKPASNVAEETPEVEVPEDTPSPEKKRRGWWQRASG